MDMRIERYAGLIHLLLRINQNLQKGKAFQPFMHQRK